MKLKDTVMNFLNSPLRVLVISFSVVFAWLLFDGTLFRLWVLDRDQTKIEVKIDKLKKETEELTTQIQEAKGLEFIERQARLRFDLVESDDLIFLFSE